MGLPKKALKESQLLIKTVGSAVDDGSHQTFKVSFIENGKTFEGFYKKLAPKKDYPELLAKMSVATSLFKRIFQGKRSAEERLVFDDKDQLVGTLSINVEGFKPFNFASEPAPAESNAKELVVPSTKTLIEKNIIEILFGRWFLDDDDSHPHNLSLAGDIDFDMFWYWFTIYMKSPRAGIGIPKTRVTLTVADWEHFPNIRDPKLYHWPSYKHPGQESIPDVIPGQGQILNKVLPKPYADPTQFEKLAQEPVAQEQKFAAALKALLTFQPDMVRNQLTELFGDMPLNYTSLDDTNVELRITYEKTFPQFCNEKTNVKKFVDFIMDMYQEHYDNLYRVVVFYMGCENNGYSVPLPATFNTLYHKPSFYREIEAWVKEQNEIVYSKDLPAFQYDLPELQKRYHQVWRDAYAPTLKELLHGTYKLTNRLLTEVSNKGSIEVSTEVIETKDIGKNPNDASLTKAWDLFGDLPILSKEKLMPLIRVDKQSNFREALLLLIEFTNHLNEITKTYYEKERQNLTEKDNLVFSSQLSQLYTEYNLRIRQGLQHTGTFASEFNVISTRLKQFTEQVNFQLHLTTTDEQMKETAVTSISKEILPLNNVDLIKQFNTSLFLWARGLRPDVFNQYIIEIIDTKYKSILSLRQREKPVKDYLLISNNETCDNRLAYIFSSANGEAGALNVLLIEHLTPLMLQSQHITSIKAAIKDGTFNTPANLDLYTRATVSYSSDAPRLIHLYSVEGMQLFHKTMYSWIEKLDSAKFKGIINAAMAEYEKHIWGWSTSRRAEVEGYYRYKSQAKILGLIFVNGRDSSTLNGYLFQKIIDTMKADINKNVEKQQDPGNKLIMQFNSLENKPHYMKDLKAYAVEYTHKPEAVEVRGLVH